MYTIFQLLGKVKHIRVIRPNYGELIVMGSQSSNFRELARIAKKNTNK